MSNSDDTQQDVDVVDVLQSLVDDAIRPINRRLSRIETTLDLVLVELRPVCQRLAELEQRQAHAVLTPIPRASSR